MADQIFAASQYYTQEPSDEIKKSSLGTGIHYCRECNNMMSPRAPQDRENGVLEFYCPHCNISEAASDNRVYVNVLKRTTENSFFTQKSIADDPTLRREVRYCEQCDQEVDCVFFMAPTLAGEESMTLMLECTKCHNQWKESH